MNEALKQAILNETRQLGFLLAGVTTPDPPPHLSAFENWLAQERHASMDYLASDRSRSRRADPRLVLPECKSILVLALPYTDPKTAPVKKALMLSKGRSRHMPGAMIIIL